MTDEEFNDWLVDGIHKDQYEEIEDLKREISRNKETMKLMENCMNCKNWSRFRTDCSFNNTLFTARHGKKYCMWELS